MTELTPSMKSWDDYMKKPQMKSCFARGFKSFYKGWLDNPYRPNSDKSKEWERGFQAAFMKNSS